VIYNTGLINTAILDGFTIQGGNSTDFGGGIYNSASSPEFIHCTFSSNYANNGGGGMYNYNSSMPTLNNCTIKSNSTNGDGGGMYNSISSSPWMTDCTIMLNHAGIAGGGMSNYQSSPQMTNCWITENYALSGGGINTINSATLGLINCTIEENYTTVGNGGGMYNSGSTLELTNCYITGNYAATDGSNGGGIYNTGSTLTLTNCQLSNNIVNEDGGGICNVSSSLSLINCTITVNTANNGGGISNDGLAPTIKNSIIWGNSATSSGNQICNYSGTITLSYSCFANGTDNINNLETFTPDEYCINTNPRFFNPNNDFRIAGDSPCADAGNEEYNDEEFDIRGAINLRKLLKTNASQSGPIDMGAYEYNADNDPAEPEVFRIYVNANASGDNDGTSWTDAYTSLQDALTDAGRFYDIWVAAGTYYPTTGEDPDISFNMKNDVAIYGGFAGTETDFSERNWATYVTILSGDVGDAGVSSDNSTHVVFNSNVSSTAILDGFTIQGGMAIGGGGSGGGVCNEFSSPTFANCMITGNFALIGGGIGNSMDSSPQLSNCTITSNSASNSGGGVFNLGSSATLINCFISGNQSTSDGGGVFNSNSNTSLTNCTISDNSAQNGGGIGNYESSPEFTNCIISDNQAIGDGGGIYNLSNSSPTLINCTISGNISGANGGGVGNWNSLPLFVNCLIYMNSAISGGGIYNSSNSTLNNCTITGNTAVNGGGVYYLNSTSSSSIINNSIIWGNIASSNGNQIYYSNGTSTLRYSCYANETGDIHNNGGTFAPDAYCITDNPKFVFVAGNDFRIFGNSPCKNTGYNGNNATTVDIRGKARIQNITIDMGAYEYTEGFDPALPIVLRIYVNANATGLNNGTSWANAYTSLQTALSVATPGSEIWVTAATYKPTAGTERSISFSLKNGVAIYGGFAGTETDLSQRNWTTNVTILSGDIGTNGNNADNSYHVIHNTNLNNTAILDGFTITGGNVDIVSVGGGIINELSSPLVTNCTISENSAGSGGGGGIGNMDYSSPVFTNCIISGNHAVAFGGGIINEGHSTPIFTNCTISGNSAANGGGICNWNGNSLVMSNCTISNNNATNLGGGLYNIDNSSTSLISCTISGNQSNHGAGVYNTNAYLVLTNCLISGNTATSNGGGVCNALSITLINCTITGNHAANGGGIYNGSSSVVNNSIIWGNTAISGNQIYNYGVATMLDYSCYANGAGDVVNAGGTFTPINCITTDPKFVSVADNDYRIFGNSPCTNSGFNTYNTTAFDIRGQARIQNIIDMGAYEWTSSLDPGEVFTWTGTASSNWNSTDNWSSGTVPSAISVVSIPDVTTNDPIVNENPGSPAVCNDLMIETGAALTIAAGKALTVYGTLTNSAGTDGLVIKSDATGTGSLITNSTPNAKVERYVNAWIDATHGWHLLSSPVSSQAISTAFTDVTLANYDFYQWNEPTKNWLNQKDGGNSIINFVPGT
jgi:parallel beta-helix repeat protein